MKLDEWDFRLIRSVKKNLNYGDALPDCTAIWIRRCALPVDTKLPLTYYIVERMLKICQHLDMSIIVFVDALYDERLWMVGASKNQPYYERVFFVLASFLSNLPVDEIPGYKEWLKDNA